jgi:hypothetical protein
MSNSIDDLEEVLKDIRNVISRYKRHKQAYLRPQVQEARCDLAILRFQLADIGSELYGWKIESAAAYENAKLRKEEEVENALNALTKAGQKQVNVGDRAKRTAKLETSQDEMIKADKMNRLAINLYQYSIPDILHSMSSRLGSFDRPETTSKPQYQEVPDDGYEKSGWDSYEKRAIDGLDRLEDELE